MELLPTPQFGNPAKWPAHAGLIASVIWQESERLYDEKLIEADMAYQFGRQVDGVDVMLAVPESIGIAFARGITHLIKSGVVSVSEPLNFDTFLLTTEFIEAQQKAYQASVGYANRVADLMLEAHGSYMTTIERLGTCKTFEKEMAVRRTIGVFYQQIQRLVRISHQARKDGRIDKDTWSNRMQAALLKIKSQVLAYAQVN